MRNQRIRWPNVAKLAGGVAIVAALIFTLPTLLKTPEPPALDSDIGLAPPEVVAPETNLPPEGGSGAPDSNCSHAQGATENSNRDRSERPMTSESARRGNRDCNEANGSRANEASGDGRPPGGGQNRDRQGKSGDGHRRPAGPTSPAAPVPTAPPGSSPAPPPPPPAQPQAPTAPPLIREFGL